MAIDKDKNLHSKESLIWSINGVKSIRVDTMCEGIKYAKHEEFLFIVINFDNINCLPKLKHLRSVTASPILIATSNFTMEDHAIAIKNGANAFGLIGSPESNMDSINAILGNISRNLHPEICESIVLHDLLIFPKDCKVLINESEIFLSKLEMRVLCLLIKGNGRFYRNNQISEYIYDYDNENDTFDSIKNIIMRIRKKIGFKNIIITKWKQGYKIGAGFLI